MPGHVNDEGDILLSRVRQVRTERNSGQVAEVDDVLAPGAQALEHAGGPDGSGPPLLAGEPGTGTRWHSDDDNLF
ncbi:MAG: hypothetical protein O7F16_09800 [Acidobacteria bacterium]|nr:hypothetical protein [Acidobacteriota bacterium]